MSLSTDPPVITRLPFLVNQFIEAVEDPESGDSPVGHRNTVSGGELPAVSSRVAPQPPANRLDPSRIEDGSKTAPGWVTFPDSHFFVFIRGCPHTHDRQKYAARPKFLLPRPAGNPTLGRSYDS